MTFEHLPTPQGDVIWELLRAPKLKLSRPACLYLLQGATLAQLAGEQAWVERAGSLIPGRLQLLRWKHDAFWMGAGHLEDVALAHVLELPPGLSVEAVTPAFLAKAFV